VVFLSQLCKLKLPNILVTTSGAIEEDLIKSTGESFEISSFYADDTALHEKGSNRVGNLVIRNESYMKFEDLVVNYLEKVYEKKKRISTSELLKEIGLMLEDENSILYQASKK